MPLPTPPSSPDIINTVLAYRKDTTRTNTWVMSGHAKLKACAAWGVGGDGEDGPYCDVGVGLYGLGTIFVNAPDGGVNRLAACPGAWCNFTISIDGPFGSGLYYRITGQVNSDPIDLHPGTGVVSGSGNCGLEWVLVIGQGFTYGGVPITTTVRSTIPNNATLGGRVIGPTPSGGSWHAEIAPATVDGDWTITIAAKEQLVSANLHEAAYEWVATHVTLSCAGSTLSYAVPTAQQFALDSVCTATMNAWSHDANWTAYGSGAYDQWFGYVPDFYAEVSNWGLTGTRAGNNFRGFPGSPGGGITLPVTSTLGGSYGTVGTRSVRIGVQPGAADAPVSSTPGNPAYTWYISDAPAVRTGVILAELASVGGLFLAPISPNTISGIVELWWDGTSYARRPTDGDAITMAAEVSTWNTQVGQGGTRLAIPTGHLTGAGFVTSLFIVGDTLTYIPQRLFEPSPSPLTYYNYARFIVDGGNDPFHATGATLGRDIGTLTLSKPGLILPSITLSVASDAMGGSNTDAYATDLSNWACERWLSVQCATISLAPGHKATLTITQASGTATVYTLTPDAGTGIAIIDLACPDNQADAALGVGVGLYNPVPVFVSDGSSGYKRSTTDVPTPAADSHVASLTLTVPGASETFDITSMAFVSYTGNDSWTDPRGDGGGYSYEVAMASSARVPVHIPAKATLNVLADGKIALRYPVYAHLTNYSGYRDYNSGYQDYYDIPLMMSDLLYDMPALANGMTAAFAVTFTPPGGGPAITADNCPVGLAIGDDVPLGDHTYQPWTSHTRALTVRRELTKLTVPTYNTRYRLAGKLYHGGGMEGLAIEKRAKGQALPGKAIRITHRGAQNSSSDPPVTSAASNAPTGTQSYTTDSVGFWRAIFYEDFEAPIVIGMQNPGDMPVPYPLGLYREANISALTYIHFVALFLVSIPGVCCLAPPWGSFLVAAPRYVSGDPQGIAFYRRDIGVPTIWDAMDVVISPTAGDGNPSLAYDPRGRLICQFERSGAGVMETVSDDDGDTWGTAVMTIANGQYPRIAVGKDGSLYRVAYLDDGSGASTGTLKGQWQAPGDAAPSAAFDLLKADGVTKITAQIGGFDIDHMAESAGRWILTVLEPGNTSPTEWVSADDSGGTFTPV